jgi:undecaprenyl-diphosphatase
MLVLLFDRTKKSLSLFNNLCLPCRGKIGILLSCDRVRKNIFSGVWQLGNLMLDFIWRDMKRVEYLSCNKQELNTRPFGGGCISFFPSWPLRTFLQRLFFKQSEPPKPQSSIQSSGCLIDIKNFRNKPEPRSAIAALIFLGFFIAIMLNLSNSRLLLVDDFVNTQVTRIQANLLVEIAKGIGFAFESPNVVFYIIIFCGILFIRGKTKEFFLLSISGILTSILVYSAKILTTRARPVNRLIEKADYSFPSGHACVSVVFFGVLIFLALRYLRPTQKIAAIIPCVLLILIIGFSRVYLNVHWFSDCLGGFVFGLFLLFGVNCWFES